MPRLHRSPPRNPPAADCPLEDCLGILAGAWVPKILWFLRDGPRRFGDLKRDCRGISKRVLANQLKKLEKQGAIARAVISGRPTTVEYALTPAGRELQPVLDAMARVGVRLRAKELV